VPSATLHKSSCQNVFAAVSSCTKSNCNLQPTYNLQLATIANGDTFQTFATLLLRFYFHNCLPSNVAANTTRPQVACHMPHVSSSAPRSPFPLLAGVEKRLINSKPLRKCTSADTLTTVYVGQAVWQADAMSWHGILYALFQFISKPFLTPNPLSRPPHPFLTLPQSIAAIFILK